MKRDELRLVCLPIVIALIFGLFIFIFYSNREFVGNIFTQDRREEANELKRLPREMEKAILEEYNNYVPLDIP